jgi:hypothetical protein
MVILYWILAWIKDNAPDLWRLILEILNIG